MSVRAVGGDARGVQHRAVVAKISRFWTEGFDLRGVEFPGVLWLEKRVIGPGKCGRKKTQDDEYE